MAKVDISNIVKVYSGKPGCMCGCNGKYSYNPVHQEHGSKSRGYTVHDYECFERSIKIIAGKVLNHPDVVVEDDYAYVMTGSRNLFVYFKKDEA